MDPKAYTMDPCRRCQHGSLSAYGGICGEPATHYNGLPMCRYHFEHCLLIKSDPYYAELYDNLSIFDKVKLFCIYKSLYKKNPGDAV